jgi:hypothetical protein
MIFGLLPAAAISVGPEIKVGMATPWFEAVSTSIAERTCRTDVPWSGSAFSRRDADGHHSLSASLAEANAD